MNIDGSLERRRWTARISQKIYIPSLVFLIFFGIYYESSILTTPHHTVDAQSCKTQHRLRYRDHPVSSIRQIRRDCAHLCDDANSYTSTNIPQSQCRAFFHLNFFPSNLYPDYLSNFTANGTIAFVNKSSPFPQPPIAINTTDFRDKRTLIISGANSSSIRSGSSLPTGVSMLTSLHDLTTGDSTRIYSSEEFERKFVCNDLRPFDTVVVEDLNEHLNPWNDVITIAKAWCVTKSGSQLIMLFPTDKFSGTDAVFNDLRRSYGTRRLQYITRNWKQIGERKYFNGNENQSIIAFTFVRP